MKQLFHLLVAAAALSRTGLFVESWTNHRLMHRNAVISKRSFLPAAVKDDNSENDELPLDFNLGSDTRLNEEGPKLGIDLGSMLDPLSEQEANELKAAAAEVINDAIAEGLDEIDALRNRMKREFRKKRESMAAQSELNAQRESVKLLNKIDVLTDAFLQETASQRRSTKLAAAADQSMEGGRGLDWGAWGTIKGATVGMASSSLIGSVDQAQQMATAAEQAASESSKTLFEPATPSNRVVILADVSSDPYAKKMIPDLTESLQQALPGLAVDVYKPTATVPIGADNAACVVVFCTSWTDRSTLYAAFDRLLRKTLQSDGALGTPPTQLVAVSTLGTERTDKMPYTLQNMLGRKLDQRRQIEEAIISTVQNRVTEPAMDYTLCKFGELKDSTSDQFGFAPGDVLDGSTDPETAVTVLTQAIAFQPAARNATLSCVGKLPSPVTELEMNNLLDDAFLKLDGPELFRQVLAESDVSANYASLVEYIREWAEILAETGKGLTTPIRAVAVSDPVAKAGVQLSQGIQLLFLPTATGKSYLSREEEQEQEAARGKATTAIPRKREAKEGGVQVMVEITRENKLRIRAKRCNYLDDAVIKEMTEETILSRLREVIQAWANEHKN